MGWAKENQLSKLNGRQQYVVLVGPIVWTTIKLKSVDSTQLTDCTQILNQANCTAQKTFESTYLKQVTTIQIR